MLLVWLKTFVQRHLDLTLKPTAKVAARIIERPGLWMNDTQLESLTSELRSIARRALPSGNLTYGVLRGERRDLERIIVTLLYERVTKRPIAFNALAVMENDIHGRRVEVLHMGLVMIDPEVRSQGLSWLLYGFTCLLLFARNQLRPVWLSNVTQVPAIVGLMIENFSEVFPSPTGRQRASFEQLLLARQIMTHHRSVFGVGSDATFDEDRFVITNAYTGGSDDLKKTFEAAPKHRNTVYNEFCARVLDYDRGDDVLQLAKLDLAAAKKFILGELPRSSLPAALGALTFVALNRLVLPIIYWLTTDRPWGILRPNR